MNKQEPHENVHARRVAVIGLVVIVALVLGGLLLTRVLRGASQIQDCVMSGRTNCAPIDSPPRKIADDENSPAVSATQENDADAAPPEDPACERRCNRGRERPEY